MKENVKEITEMEKVTSSTRRGKSKNKKFKKNNGKARNSKRTTIDNSDYGAHNDSSWYTGHAALAMDAGSVPYGIPLGRNLGRSLVSFSGDPVSYIDDMVAIPGIVRLTIGPTFGMSNGYSSPINRAAQMLYSFVRHVNSGHANYDPNDLMMYIGAMSSVYSYITWLDRLYGTFQVYAQMNSYMPKDIIQAMCVDFDDLQLHMMDLKYYIDQLTVRASAFCVPGDLSLFKRMAFMYEGIYTDGNSSKCGIYFYNPSFFYKYDETTAGGGKLVVEPFFTDGNSAKFNDLVTYGNTLLDAVAGSEDVGIMSGDILKAYGQDKLVKIATVPFGYTVLPVYSEEVLEQMHNAKCMIITPDFTDSFVKDEWALSQFAGIGGYLYCNPLSGEVPSSNTPVAVFDKQLISSRFDPVSPEVSIVNTRLTITGDLVYNEDTAKLYFRPNSCGSEIVTAIDAFVRYNDTISRTNLAGQAASGNHNRTILNAATLIHFRYMPEIIMRTASNPSHVASIMDVDNYAVLDKEELRNIHESAWLSMLKVPTMGLYESGK